MTRRVPGTNRTLTTWVWGVGWVLFLAGCSSGSESQRCTYDTDCSGPLICRDGVCVSLCDGVECAPGNTCVSGRCLPEPCSDTSCQDPPGDPACFDLPATCSKGLCQYQVVVDRYCDDRDACTSSDSCLSTGRCAGTPMRCVQPPDPKCKDGQTLIVNASPGVCQNGNCSYASVEVTCPDGCLQDACRGDPCGDVVCDQPPDAACVTASNLRVFSDEGVCQDGVCTYPFVDVVCALGCENDACLDCQPKWVDLSDCECTPSACKGCQGTRQQTDGCGDTRAVACTREPTGCDTVCCAEVCCQPGQVCYDQACCTPGECGGLGLNCGDWDDGCGDRFDCGSCSSGDWCDQGTCVPLPPRPSNPVAYYFAESDWFGHYLEEVSGFTDSAHLKVCSFSGGWDDFTGFIAAAEKARELGMWIVPEFDYLFRSTDSSEWDTRLRSFRDAVGDLADLFWTIYLIDEPDSMGVELVSSAAQAVRTVFPDVPLMSVYIMSFDREIADELDYVGFDAGYQSEPGRVAFETSILGALYRVRTATNKPLILVGKAYDRDFIPMSEAWYYYEAYLRDPRIFSLWWFLWADAPGHDFNGTRHYPALAEIHRQISAEIRGQNLLTNGGFENAATGWSKSANAVLTDAEANNDINSNPGFEDGPTNWTAVGSPSIVGTAHSGTHAARVVGADNVYYRRVPVTMGNHYRLSQWMQAESGSARARVQVNWLDASLQYVDHKILLVSLDSEWRKYDMTVVAPAGVAWALVYVTAHAPGEVALLDDIYFGDLTYQVRVHSGRYAAEVDSVSPFTQVIPVSPGSEMTLWQWMRGSAGGEIGRLQINWSDADDVFISTNIETKSLSTAYQQFRMDVTVPAGASFARVYASGHFESQRIHVDDVTLVQR